MNKRNSQRIYNIKQGRNVSSEMPVVQSKSTTEIASEKSLTQFDYIRSKRTTPSSRFYKNGWFHWYKLQQDILRKSKKLSLLLIGDSIAYGLSVILIYGKNMEILPQIAEYQEIKSKTRYGE